ncbi:Uncharacterised protein [Yersinia enterocolitica]|nr:Uncharacterised protein [Yersinia enterocolitica]
MIPSFSSTQSMPLRRVFSAFIGRLSAAASPSPNNLPALVATSKVSCVVLTGLIRSANPFESCFTLSLNQLNTGLSGSKAALIGPMAAVKPSATPAIKALIGSQYLRISRPPATMAATTATIGHVNAVSAVAMVPPISEKLVLNRPAPANSRLNPATTGHAISPSAPSPATSANAAPVTLVSVATSSGFFLAQTATFISQSVAVLVSLRSAESCCSNTSIRKSSHAELRFFRSPSRLSILIVAIDCAVPSAFFSLLCFSANLPLPAAATSFTAPFIASPSSNRLVFELVKPFDITSDTR